MGELVKMDTPGNIMPPKTESFILIKFGDINSTVLEIHYQNVSPVQAVAAAWLLEKEAERTVNLQRENSERQREISKIAIPNRG